MTIKKSLISVAASAAIIAAATGCSSDSTTAPVADTSGVASSITASKGYINDANTSLLAQYTYVAGSKGVYDANLIHQPIYGN